MFTKSSMGMKKLPVLCDRIKAESSYSEAREFHFGLYNQGLGNRTGCRMKDHDLLSAASGASKYGMHSVRQLDRADPRQRIFY